MDPLLSSLYSVEQRGVSVMYMYFQVFFAGIYRVKEDTFQVLRGKGGIRAALKVRRE